jgi:UDP-N-acetylglucosamine--N-acetylmuramyl-(pentapeptide) pyrophosphoryl-undecaprenol N-acetylglucosamine transferase
MEKAGVIAHPPRTLHGRRIAIAGGGTAGHVQPALAVAEAYRSALPDVDILFLGTPDGAESRLVPAHGYRLATVTAAPFFGVGTAGRLRSVTALMAGAVQARRVLRAEGSELVLGFGNFASAGALLGARTIGLRTVIHEANAVAGVANRLLGRLVDRVLLGFAEAAPAFPLRTTALTGTPVRAAVRALAGARAEPRAPGPVRVLVVGGSQGSPFLNANVPGVVVRVARRGVPLEVRHQTGRGDPAQVRAAYQRGGVAADVQTSFDDVTAAYRWADLAIACAGAITLAELAIAALPALLVPLATAALDHQRANARAFAVVTGAWWTGEDAWDAAVAEERLAVLVASAGERRAAAARMAAAARPDAAHAVVAACESLLTATRAPAAIAP